MKWQFKHQGFQRQAAEAVTEVFRGQPHLGAVNYRLEPGHGAGLPQCEHSPDR